MYNMCNDLKHVDAVTAFQRKCKNIVIKKYLVVDHQQTSLYTRKCVKIFTYLIYTLTFEYKYIFHYIISIAVTII